MREPTRRETFRGAAVLGTGLLGVSSYGELVAAQSGGTRVNTWSASHHAPAAEGISAQGFEDQTVRQVLHTSVRGSDVQVRLANTFGQQELSVDRVTAGVRADGAGVDPETMTTVNFDGSPAVSVPPGDRVLSDPVNLSLPADSDVVVSFYTAGPTGPTSWHSFGKDQTYVADGDVVGVADSDPFSDAAESYFFVDGVDVIAPESEGTIVCFGDSITNGAGSSSGANATYPDFLYRRIANSDILEKSVVNAGINGNRLLHDSPPEFTFGPSGLSRFDRDALGQTGVTDVILLIGVNDIIHSEAEWLAPDQAVTADQIIDGMQELIGRCHDAGVRILGGTIMPFGEYSLYGETPEQKRTAVNHWIRNEADFDAVLDFAAFVADPSDPHVMLSQYDSGDGLHPGDRGYRAMAQGIDLWSLTTGRRPTTTTSPTTTARQGTTTVTETRTQAAEDSGDGGSLPGFGFATGAVGVGAGALAAAIRWRGDNDS